MSTEMDDLSFAFAVTQGGPDQIFHVKTQARPQGKATATPGVWRSSTLCRMHLRLHVGGEGLGDTAHGLEATVRLALQWRDMRRLKIVSVKPMAMRRECDRCRVMERHKKLRRIDESSR